jgi:hypothetical protein
VGGQAGRQPRVVVNGRPSAVAEQVATQMSSALENCAAVLRQPNPN